MTPDPKAQEPDAEAVCAICRKAYEDHSNTESRCPMPNRKAFDDTAWLETRFAPKAQPSPDLCQCGHGPQFHSRGGCFHRKCRCLIPRTPAHPVAQERGGETADEIAHLKARLDDGETNSEYVVKGAVLAVLIDERDALREERDELASWKSQQLELESQWEAQSVGRLLKLTLGQSIYPNIQPGIEKLLTERDAAVRQRDALVESAFVEGWVARNSMPEKALGTAGEAWRASKALAAIAASGEAK